MTSADFKTLMPQFSGVSDPDILRWIARVTASPGFEVARWGDDYAEGLGNLVAWGLVDEGAAGVPPTPNVSNFATMKKVGQLQTEYSEAAMAAVADDPYQSNKYGRRYRALARQVGRGGVAV